MQRSAAATHSSVRSIPSAARVVQLHLLRTPVWWLFRLSLAAATAVAPELARSSKSHGVLTRRRDARPATSAREAKTTFTHPRRTFREVARRSATVQDAPASRFARRQTGVWRPSAANTQVARRSATGPRSIAAAVRTRTTRRRYRHGGITLRPRRRVSCEDALRERHDSETHSGASVTPFSRRVGAVQLADEPDERPNAAPGAEAPQTALTWPASRRPTCSRAAVRVANSAAVAPLRRTHACAARRLTAGPLGGRKI